MAKDGLDVTNPGSIKGRGHSGQAGDESLATEQQGVRILMPGRSDTQSRPLSGLANELQMLQQGVVVVAPSRADTLRFRQVHLDFHTSELIEQVGRDFDGEDFAATLKSAGVDSVTCFAKCHHGMFYYDSRFGPMHPHLHRELLKEQIESCHRYGIKVPIYISVTWDSFTAGNHPEWREVDTDGRLAGPAPLDAPHYGWPKLCLNSPYADHLIATVGEVLDLFDVDGLFFDIVVQGECCCRNCMEGMRREGLEPSSQADRLSYAQRVLNSFKEELSAYVWRRLPECPVFYNSGHIGPYVKSSIAAYSHLEIESLPGGDWGYEHFPLAARYARNLGLEFIGMTGKFHKSWADFGGFKNPAALEYECFSALALGGGCSIGDQLHPSGRMDKATYELIGGVYQQVAQKEPWCAGATAVTEIGVITPEIFSLAPDMTTTSDPLAGAHRMLKECHYQYDIVDFDMDLSKYRVLILPDDIKLEETTSHLLNDYLDNGGKLLLSYRSGTLEGGLDFGLKDVPARVKSESPFLTEYLVAGRIVARGIPASKHVMYEPGLQIEATDGAKTLAEVWEPYFDRTYKHFCSHRQTPFSGSAGRPGVVANDRMVYIGWPIFGMYKRHGSRVYRELTVNALSMLLPYAEKSVQTDAPTTAEIALNYQAEHDRYVLHVLHYIPERRYRFADTIEDVIPLYDVEIDLALPEGYDKAMLVPDRTYLEASRSEGRLRFTIPKVCGHAMVALER